MLTALDAPPDRLDENEQSFVANIREHGWFRTSVFADGVHQFNELCRIIKATR